MSEFSKTEAVELTAELKDAMQLVLEKHGLKLANYHTTYGNIYRLKVELSKPNVNDDGFDEGTREARDYRDMAGYYRLPVEALFTEFSSSGRRWRLMGLNPKARKYPVVAVDTRDGKEYKLTVEMVREALETN